MRLHTTALCILVAVLVLGVSMLVLGTVQGQSGGPVGQSSSDWELTFEDTFSGSSLSSSRWIPGFPWMIPSDGCNISNTTPNLAYTPDNVTVSNGTAKLTARVEPITCRGEDKQYTSGIITTGNYHYIEGSNPKFAQQYGYFEARVRMPVGQGLWPAFWLNAIYPKWPPEIDAMENLGHQPNRAYMCLHGPNHTGGGCGTYDGLTAGGWHVFGLEWTEDAVRWYIDGTLRRTVTTAWQIPHEPMYLLLNLQVGGEWPGEPQSDSVFPAVYEVDYVRAWKASTAVSTPTATPTPTPVANDPRCYRPGRGNQFACEDAGGAYIGPVLRGLFP